jgi:ribosomal protein S15P/S13E
MAKNKKDKRTNNNLQNITQKNKLLSYVDIVIVAYSSHIETNIVYPYR